MSSSRIPLWCVPPSVNHNSTVAGGKKQQQQQQDVLVSALRNDKKNSSKKVIFNVTSSVADGGMDATSCVPPLAAELADFFSRGGMMNNSSNDNGPIDAEAPISVVVCADSNAALYVAETMLHLAPAVVAALCLSVPSRGSTAATSPGTTALSTRFRSIITTAAVARGMSSGRAPSRVLVTTIDSLAAHVSSASSRGAEDDDHILSCCDVMCLLPGVDGSVFTGGAGAGGGGNAKCDGSIFRGVKKFAQFQVAASAGGGKKKVAAAAAAAAVVALPVQQAAAGIFTPHPELAELPVASQDDADDTDDDYGNGAFLLSRFFDDDAITLLACCGDIPGCLSRIRHLHDTRAGNIIENTLRATLLGGLWMLSSPASSASSSAASCPAFAIHVKLAHIFRQLLDRSGQVDENTGRLLGTEPAAHQTLRFQASRAVASVAAALEPLAVQNSPTLAAMVPRSINNNSSSDSNRNPPFLFHLICSYAVGVAPHSALDALCAAWGVLLPGSQPGTATASTLIAGTNATKQAARKQGTLVHALRMKFATRLGDAEVSFLEFVLHALIDTAARLAAVTVGEVRRWLLWDVFFAPQYGPLTPFLNLCELLPVRQTLSPAAAKAEDDRALLLIPGKFKTGALACKDLPLAGAAQRQVDFMHTVACEEVLSAMPSGRVPMYIGDVGNLIGAWHKYNNKYGGKLGLTLTDFLTQHPDKFRVVGNVVMRVTESKTQPVRLRYDNDDGSGSDDDDMFGGKRNKKTGAPLSKKRREQDAMIAKSGLPKKHTPRSRKKAMRQAQNRLKFDKNRKALSKDAHVPGYNKPHAKKVKGRGVKVNARSWKR